MVRKRSIIVGVLGVLLISTLNTQAQIGSKLKGVLEELSTTAKDTVTAKPQADNQAIDTSEVSEKEANNAVKQALANGLKASVKSLAVQDGFLGDAAVKILMPEEAQKVEKALRAVG